MLKIYTNDVFHRHDTGVGHPENARRLDAAIEGVDRAGMTADVIRDAAPHEETERIIAKVHSADYERELDEACRMGARLFHSLDNPISSASFAAARTAVATSLAAADAMLREDHARAFVIARPPGHHAEKATAMGFCFFNTIACVAEWLREQPGIERVFVFDFDVHHGNGTQHLFEERDDVFYASTHRYPFYPGTGAADEIGIGKGRGFTKNIPFDAGTGDDAYLRAVEDEIVRIIDDYRPNAILLSSGFDAHRRDPLGGMRVTEGAYGEITERVVECAERWCEGRVLSLLEGGYDMEGLAASVDAHVRSMSCCEIQNANCRMQTSARFCSLHFAFCIHDRGVQRLQPRDAQLLRESDHDMLACVGRHASGARGIVDHVGDGHRQGGAVFHRNEPAHLRRRDELAVAARVGGHDRLAHGHGLADRAGDAGAGPRGIHHQIA